MAETMTKTVVNCATGETTYEPMTTEEIAKLETDRANAEKVEKERQAQIEAQAETKASAFAKLAALGLTEDEAKAIAG